MNAALSIRFNKPVEPLVHNNLVFTNGWSNYDTGQYNAGRYTKFADGSVVLSGMVKGGVLSEVIGILPVGCRPSSIEVFAIQTSSGLGRLEVSPNGYVILISGGVAWVSFSGLIFKAEN
ncbi:hypothetical protein D3C85_1087360 [compost metagenome]